MLDPHERRVMQVSTTGQELLEKLDVPYTYPAIESFFQVQSHQDLMASTSPRRSRTVQKSGRVIGYTIHQVSKENLCILYSDVTEKKRLEAIAETANLMDNIGFVFAGIRHELGNPINAIKTAVTVLHRERHRLPDETIERLLEQTLSNIGRVEYLLRTLRGFSLFDEVNSEAIEIRSFFESFFSLASRDLAIRGVTSELLVPESRALWVEGDPRALQQVVLNLLTNSLDALEEIEAPKITVGAEQDAHFVIVTFTDNGRGITDEAQADLFKPFHTTKVNGSGLGLFITKRMLTSMRSQINISSTPGVGTTVTLTLPRVER